MWHLIARNGVIPLPAMDSIGGLINLKTSSYFINIATIPNLLKMADRGVGDNHQFIEESDEGKAFMSGFEDQQVEQSAC